MTPIFEKTDKQIEAIKLLGSKAKNIMIYGGSRSGKTFIIIYALIIRASKCRSRHLILRDKFNAVKTSVWMDTMPKVLSLCFPNLPVQWNKTDYYITLPNGSEIWIGGLDNRERTEKILGKEYSTIFFNECSQLDYSSVMMAHTRLAEKNELKKKFYYDENPPTKRHWSYWTFIRHWHPTDECEIDKEQYVSMLINPTDNLQNIDEDYIDDILKKLPEKERLRFLEGKFLDSDDGAVYYAFDRDVHVQEFKPSPYGSTLIGMDFNVDPMTCVIAQIVDNKIYVFDEVFDRNSNTFAMCDKLLKKGHKGSKVYPDSTGRNRKTSGKSDVNILSNAGFQVEYTRNPFVVDRVNNINRLLTERRIVVHPKCTKLINDLEKVAWKGNDLDQKSDPLLTHISDGLGYLAWSIFPITDTNVRARIRLS